MQAVHCLHGSMALLTGDILSYVALVIEENVLGYIGDLLPGGRGSGVEVPVFFPYLRMFGNYVFVAIETFFHRRNSRIFGTPGIRVAELALDILYPCMDSVAEGYGLLGSDPPCGRNVELIEEHHRQYNRKAG